MTADPFVCPCWEQVEARGWNIICGRPGCARGWARRQRDNANAQLVLDTFSPEVVDVPATVLNGPRVLTVEPCKCGCGGIPIYDDSEASHMSENGAHGDGSGADG